MKLTTILKKAIYALILFQGISYTTLAQKNIDEGKDINDLLFNYFSKKKSRKIDTVGIENGKVSVTILPAFGYSLTTKFAVNAASNIVFKRPNANISSFVLAPTLTSRKQILLPIRGSVWTANNKYNIVSDWRIMKYPQSTYGIGSNSKLSNEIPMDYWYMRMYQTFYKKIGGNFYGGVGIHLDYHWKIKTNMPNNESTYTLYELGIPSRSISVGYSANFLYDNRENSIYPKKGLYINANLRQNSTFLKSDYKATTLIIDARKYIKLSPKNDNVLAFWSYNWLTLDGKIPYLDLPSTGWDTFTNTARGYIQGRLRGLNYLYFESEYRFNITKNNFLGGVVFTNAQTVTKTITPNIKSILPGVGIGLRLKVNKHSNTNLGIDYGFGIEGSRGLFLNIGEVF